jgi:hypothetical protein
VIHGLLQLTSLKLIGVERRGPKTTTGLYWYCCKQFQFQFQLPILHEPHSRNWCSARHLGRLPLARACVSRGTSADYFMPGLLLRVAARPAASHSGYPECPRRAGFPVACVARARHLGCVAAKALPGCTWLPRAVVMRCRALTPRRYQAVPHLVTSGGCHALPHMDTSGGCHALRCRHGPSRLRVLAPAECHTRGRAGCSLGGAARDHGTEYHPLSKTFLAII